MPKGKFDMAFATDGEALYLIGGSGHRRDLSKDIYTYYAKYDKWLKLQTEFTLEPQKMSTALYYAPQNRIYLFGGIGEFEPERSATRFVEFLLPDVTYIDTNTKRAGIFGKSQHEGARVAAAAWNGKIYLFGGSVRHADPARKLGYLNVVHEFDPRDGSWRSLPPMPQPKETQGCIIDHVLYTFGGYNGGSINDILTLDLRTLEWKAKGQLPRPLSGHVVVAWKKYAVLVGDKRHTNYLAIYNTETGEIKEFKTNIKGHSRGACVIDDTLYVFGGLLFTEKNSTREALYALNLGILEQEG